MIIITSEEGYVADDPRVLYVDPGALRDLFAAFALAGLLSVERQVSMLDFAQDAYNAADAMLAARVTATGEGD